VNEACYRILKGQQAASAAATQFRKQPSACTWSLALLFPTDYTGRYTPHITFHEAWRLIRMDSLVIEGGARLRGTIRINGSKNAALPSWPGLC
jgi:hypothetical protein